MAEVKIEEVMDEIRERAKEHNYNDYLPQFSSIQVENNDSGMIAGAEELLAITDQMEKFYNLHTESHRLGIFGRAFAKIINKLRNYFSRKQIHYNFLVFRVISYLADEETKKQPEDNSVELTRKMLSYQESATEDLQTRMILMENRIAELEAKLKQYEEGGNTKQ